MLITTTHWVRIFLAKDGSQAVDSTRRVERHVLRRVREKEKYYNNVQLKKMIFSVAL